MRQANELTKALVCLFFVYIPKFLSFHINIKLLSLTSTTSHIFHSDYQQDI